MIEKREIMKKDIIEIRDTVIFGIMEGVGIGTQNVGISTKSHHIVSLEENVEWKGACFTIHIEKIGIQMKVKIGIIWEKIKKNRIITREKMAEVLKVLPTEIVWEIVIVIEGILGIVWEDCR